jgi:dihydrofolate reductase
MRKLLLKMSVSVDGFCGGPQGEIDWLFPTNDDAATQWTLDIIWKAGLHIMGSRTFHDMASYWPVSTEVFAAPMNEIPKAVFSRKGLSMIGDPALSTTALKQSNEIFKDRPRAATPAIKSWQEALILTGDLAQEIRKLKDQPGKDIIAHGGASFVQSLVTTGLIDEYHLLVHPVVLGKGLPVFSGLKERMGLELVEAKAFPAGAVAHSYRVR